jgi:hypothetical protein
MEMIVNGIVVKVWANNDGGLWYYDPATGKMETVNEQSDDIVRILNRPNKRQKRKIISGTRMDGQRAM